MKRRDHRRDMAIVRQGSRVFPLPWIAGWLLLLIPVCSPAHSKTTPASPVHITEDGRLQYKADSLGNRVPDFSYCGYKASESPIPAVPARMFVEARPGDATATIQRAIDAVSAMAPDADGFRGAVLLGRGTFHLEGSLLLHTGGVVLRGSGCDEKGTLLIGEGTDRATLIRIAGRDRRHTDPPITLTPAYYPVNTLQLNLPLGHGLKVGDRVIVTRPSTQAWLALLGTDKIGLQVDYPLTTWSPGDFDLHWERVVVAASPTTLTLDVPLTMALDPRYGGATIARMEDDGSIAQVGVENLRCRSAHDATHPKDENHRWMAITFDDARDGWVRQMVAEHFVSSAVAVWESCSRITVEDCKSLCPVGEEGNYRRYSFQTLGQQVLFQRCYAEYGYHPFSVGFTTSGPNAFVQCFAYLPLNFAGAIGGWANGVLFDKMTIDGGDIGFGWRDVDGQGGGWSAANALCWQCKAARIYLAAPPTAQNWCYAFWAQGYGNGHFEQPHTFVKPESFYYAQLEARKGVRSVESDKILTYASSETTAPNAEEATLMNRRSHLPDLTLKEWIDSMCHAFPIDTLRASDVKRAVWTEAKAINRVPLHGGMQLDHGRLARNGTLLTGRRNRTSLWRGTTRPSDLAHAAPNLVRFVPGRTGRGLTDDLDTLVGDMLKNHVVAMQHFPALWYERRRDDHSRARRANAEVWAPFYEQPYARSGSGEAYDRLSRYDLTLWNSWYWLRLKQYADKAQEQGLLLIQEHYLQHNILEEGAHWADYPWRSANNINETGFPEYPALAGDKRVFMAEAFYDTTHAVRKALHKAYIRKCLDSFGDNPNVIHHLGLEYTGPLSFVQFWLDVIDGWEREHHRRVWVMLPGTEEVQEAILRDPKRSAVVNIIDILQWQYRKDGSLFAPEGGQNLTERQYARIMEMGESSFDQVYRAVSTLRRQHPDIAVVYSRRAPGYTEWASFLAGGSLPALPANTDPRLLAEALCMEPMDPVVQGAIGLGKAGAGYLLFCERGSLVLPAEATGSGYLLRWIHPDTGETDRQQVRLKKGDTRQLTAPWKGAAVAWLSRK
ncbi:MAG: DUF6298 domain-containing protein [Marinilabiliales bacterium]|nr:DUF6298 domain-containing protein [Marinilabiliales bacterium]